MNDKAKTSDQKFEEKRRPLPVHVQEKLFLDKLARRRKGEVVELRSSDGRQLKVYYTMLLTVVGMILAYALFILTYNQLGGM